MAHVRLLGGGGVGGSSHALFLDMGGEYQRVFILQKLVEL